MAKCLPLKPLRPDPDRKTPRFGVCDIESYKWIQFRVIGFGWKVYDESGIEKFRRYEAFKSLSEFCDFIFSEFPYDSIFAHFGGKFDFSFVLKEFFLSHEKYFIGTMIPRGSGLLCFEVSTFKKLDVLSESVREKDVLGKDPQGRFLIRDRTITFRDSSAMLPFGLASLTENFGVEHKKKDIDFDSFEKVTDEMLEYLEYDVWGLYEVIEEYFKWDLIKRSGSAFTVASQSLRVFRTFLTKEISSLSPKMDSFIRSGYFGGRTEVFKPFFQQPSDNTVLRSYDVNSLYPSVMRDFEYPGGVSFETLFYMEDRIGFYDVDIYVPDMYVPPLGVRYEGVEDRLIFPTGYFRGVWSTAELNYAIKLGCSIIKVHRGVICHNIGPIFKEYIDFLYEMRKQSNKSSVTNILCKLLMNSTYGRFGLNLTREQLEFDRLTPGASPHLEIPLDEDGSKTLRLMKREVKLDSSFSNVALASWVTSQARIRMHELMMLSPHDLYYSDTDSLKTTFVYDRNDEDLGKLKLEYKAKRACYILPKTYMEDTMLPIFKHFNDMGKEDGKTSKKIVMKGFDKRKISKFTREDFESALEGDMRRLRSMNPEKFAPLKSAIKKGDFLALLKESPRQIRTRYNKRRIYKRAYKQVYDTEPLHIKNGQISNMEKSFLKKWKAPDSDELKALEMESLGLL